MSAAKIKTFDVDDLDRSITDNDRLIMAETILAWADLDTGISRLIMLVFDLDESSGSGSILIGNMDLKTKAEKIKVLYDHIGNKAAATNMSKLITAMKEYSFCRNAVAHRKVIGRMTSDPTRIAFLSAKHVKGEVGKYEILAIDHSEFIASAKFARAASVKVHELMIKFEDSGDDRANSEPSVAQTVSFGVVKTM
ncbi:hypothetical protein SPAN111604_13710 [Sphingomonas antarctica]|uniref:hypothetical protein n=1 Tax=Sphingomonas antarctica TaxID=2040274 RepID=UPI0039EB4CBE